ncbi:MAG: amidohydrolase [Solidesulfovibrio sp. DCME]|uniref:amidohydrolase n=1 Tax=Solidesulfovibrio sp. DCME TaxID=3447380 RepID=UPI003D108868
MAIKIWPLGSVTPNVATDLVVPAAGKEAVVLGLFICNTGSDSGQVAIMVADAAGTILATLVRTTLDPSDTVSVDTKICLPAKTAPDTVRVLSSVAGMSFFASGDED